MNPGNLPEPFLMEYLQRIGDEWQDHPTELAAQQQFQEAKS